MWNARINALGFGAHRKESLCTVIFQAPHSLNLLGVFYRNSFTEHVISWKKILSAILKNNRLLYLLPLGCPVGDKGRVCTTAKPSLTDGQATLGKN